MSAVLHAEQVSNCPSNSVDLMSAVLHAEQVSNCPSNSIVPPGPNECCATCRAGE